MMTELRPHAGRRTGIATILFAAVLCGAAPAAAAGPPSIRIEVPVTPQAWSRQIAAAIRAGADRLGKLEFVQLLGALPKGGMGPGAGWFHPSQSRYGWQWLADRYDADRDGKIGRGEFDGTLGQFVRLDRDEDGYITAEDLDWTGKAAYFKTQAQASMLFSKMDKDTNGRITEAEWNAFFKRASGGKDHLTPETLRQLLASPPPKKDRPKFVGPPLELLVDALFKGDLGSPFEGPSLGARAPNFTLKTYDGEGEYSLAQFRGKKPVVLVFGSFT